MSNQTHSPQLEPYRNQIIQGDCREVLARLPANSVDMIFADPPYNLQLQRLGLLRPDQSRVGAVDDDWDQFDNFSDYDRFTQEWLTACRHVLRDDGTLWVIGSYHNVHRVGTILQDLDFWILNSVVWVKTNPMPNFRGVRFTHSHETLLWCTKSRDQKRYTFNYETMKALNNGKQMRSDWLIPICSGRERLMIDGEKVHTTQKPEALLYRVILASTIPDAVILDPFFGTGTTGAVARKLGRDFIGIEREEKYIVAARRRIEALNTTSADFQILGYAPNRRRAKRISFGTLVENGLIRAGQTLYFERDLQRTATIMADGRLRTPDGQIGSIHQIGVVISRMPTCNGWVSWYYRNERGTFHQLNSLRDRFRKQNKRDEE
jgi:modification methylase